MQNDQFLSEDQQGSKLWLQELQRRGADKGSTKGCSQLRMRQLHSARLVSRD